MYYSELEIQSSAYVFFGQCSVNISVLYLTVLKNYGKLSSSTSLCSYVFWFSVILGCMLFGFENSSYKEC